MGWESLALGLIFGFGVLLVYDGLVRPDARVEPRRWLKALGPRGAGAIGGAAAGFLLTGWMAAAITGAALGSAVPSLISRSRQSRERLSRIEAIAEVAARIRDSMRSGIGTYDALAQAAANPPPAIAADIRRLVADSKVSDLRTAAQSFAARVGAEGELLASALALGDEAGARSTSDVLDALAEAAMARASTLREARARQTRAKTSARVVAATPILLLLMIKQSNPGYLAPFDTAAGQLVLFVAFGLIVAGYAAMLRAARLGKGGMA
jgi:tight adherence protein B